MFGGLLDETVQSIHACGKVIDILDSFTYLGSVVHNNGGSRQKVLQQIGLAHGVMDSLAQHAYLALSVNVQADKDLNIQVAGDPSYCMAVRLGHYAPI